MNCGLIEIEPLDVWSVRDGRPFDVGGVVHARAVWPPSPWTILGMLRTLLCEALGVAAVDYGARRPAPEVRRAEDILGPADGPPTFAIGPALLARVDGNQHELCWPVPADLVTFSDARVRFGRLRTIDRQQVKSWGCGSSAAERELVTAPPDPPSGFKHPDKKPAAVTLSTTELGAWLEGSVPQERKSDENPAARALDSEPRIGIGIDPDSGTVQEGRFYVRHAHALKQDWRLVVPLAGRGHDDVPWAAITGQYARLGADGHLARLSFRDGTGLWPRVAERVKGERRACLLFLSPVRREDLTSVQIDGCQVSTRVIVAQRPVPIGGWMLLSRNGRQHGPRPLHRYYPAGTVAMVRSEGDLSKLHGRSIAKDSAEKAAGFAFCLVGAWPREER